MPKFSEFNEEEFLLQFFKDQNAGFFVDIGANNGWKGSNTRALFLKGWGGICVEADPETFKSLKATYSNDARITCFNCAVWNKDAVIEFNRHMDFDSGLSCVCVGHTDARLQIRVSVPCKTFDTLLSEAGHPPIIDLLQIDTEGCDFEILSSFSWSVVPRLIMLEHGLSRDRFDMLLAERYKRVFSNQSNSAYERLSP